MLERFEGKDRRFALLDALRSQFLVDGMTDIADVLASATQIKEFSPDTTLFAQGERSSDLYFILAGKVSVSRDEKEIAICNAGIHVGEIALLEPFKGRSATVVAIDTVVVAKISAQRFADIAKAHPDLWRRMSLELARRLVKLLDIIK